MGLQGQLSDLSSESIPILVLAIIANCACYLRSLLFTSLQSLALFFQFQPNPDHEDHHIDDQEEDDDHDELFTSAVGSGLAGLVLLSDHLKLNRVLSYRYCSDDTDHGGARSDCVVCLSELSEGHQVRKLACHHVFHKECFDGWLHQLNFNCPLCRSPVVDSDECVAITRRRVTWDLLDWFSPPPR